MTSTDSVVALPATSEGQEHGEPEAHARLRITAPVWVVIASSFVLRLAGASTAIMLAAYMKQIIGAGTDLIGSLASLFYMTELVLAPVFGAISDLRGRRMILILGPLVGALALPIYPLSQMASAAVLSVGILAMARLMEGIATAAKVPSALGYLADVTEGDSPEQTNLRGRVMGFYEITFLIGLVGGNVAGGALWEPLKTTGFYLISVIYLVAAAMLFFFVPETLPAKARELHARTRLEAGSTAHRVRALIKSRLKAYVSLLREPALRTFVPAWLAVNAIVGVMGNLIQPIMIRPREHAVFVFDHIIVFINSLSQFTNGAVHPMKLAHQVMDPFPGQVLDGKFTSAQVGLAFGAFGLVFMLGIFLWSLLYGKIRKSNVMLIAMGGLFLTCAALYGINDQVLPMPWGGWALVPLLVLGLFLVSGFTPVALAYLAEISATRVEHRGAVMGLYSVFLGIGQLVGSGGGGFLVRGINQGFNGLILTVFILAIIAGLAVVWLRIKHGV